MAFHRRVGDEICEICVSRDAVAGVHQLRSLCRMVSSAPGIAQMLKERGLDSNFVESIPVQVEEDCDYYMYVNDTNGHIMCCISHLQNSDERIVYLDFVHETVHVIQLHDGRNLFDRRYRYSKRPTELEAYRVAVEEGRLIGMSEQELFEYLKVEWMDEREHAAMAAALGVRGDSR